MSEIVATTQAEIAALKSTPEVRGQRLKSLRRMADLSRKAMEKKHSISAGTLQGWEDGRYGGLTTKGARLVLAALKEEGIHCAQEWLMHGIGLGPSFSDRLFYGQKVINRIKDGSMDLRSDDPQPTRNKQQQTIAEELLFMRKNSRDIIDIVVPDDNMMPRFAAGEYVAGSRRHGEALRQAIGFDCIVQTTDDRTLLRHVTEGSVPGKFRLSCTNPRLQNTSNASEEVNLLSAAPVIWQRRPDQDI